MFRVLYLPSCAVRAREQMRDRWNTMFRFLTIIVVYQKYLMRNSSLYSILIREADEVTSCALFGTFFVLGVGLVSVIVRSWKVDRCLAIGRLIYICDKISTWARYTFTYLKNVDSKIENIFIFRHVLHGNCC